MSRNKDLKDMAIVRAISGGIPGVSIDDDYFRREREENRREQGLYVCTELNQRTDMEKSIWRRDKFLEELNLDRWKVDQIAKTAHLEPSYHQILPSRSVVPKATHILPSALCYLQ